MLYSRRGEGGRCATHPPHLRSNHTHIHPPTYHPYPPTWRCTPTGRSQKSSRSVESCFRKVAGTGCSRSSTASGMVRSSEMPTNGKLSCGQEGGEGQWWWWRVGGRGFWGLHCWTWTCVV